MKTTEELQLIPIGKLVPYANNARTHSPEQILKLRTLGLTEEEAEARIIDGFLQA